jgi:stage V sporulation protein B
MDFIKKYFRNELLRASILLLILSNIGSLINFIFQFAMARILDSGDFGILAFLTNLIFIFGVPSFAIQTAISKKTTYLNSRGEYGKIKGMLKSAAKKLSVISAVLIPMFIVLSYFFHESVNIPFYALALTSLMLLFSLITPIIYGVMQGMKKFVMLGWNNLANFSIKLILGVAFVLIGFRVYGAILGVILGAVTAWVLGILVVKNFKEEKEEISFYSNRDIFPFIAILIITLMYSLDIIIGKFLFAPEILGNYAKVSLIGKMILFSCLTVITVMFPISSEKHLSGNKTDTVIKKASLLIGIICGLSILLIALFPELIITFLFGQKYIDYAYLLLPIGLAFSFISALSTLVLYKISINRFGKVESALLGMLLIIQVIGLILVNSDIYHFSIFFMLSSIISFIVLFLFTLVWKKSA